MKSIAGLELFVDSRGSGLIMPIQVELDNAPNEPRASVYFDGRIVSYSVIDRGNGYVSMPEINVDGDAEASLVMVGGVEEIVFKPPGTPPIPTVQLSLTPSITKSRSPTPTPTITKTPTLTATTTTTLTVSVTKSNTPSNTRTQTPTLTFTRTQTLTPSITPTNTPEFDGCSINALNNNYNQNIIFSNQNTGVSAGSGFRAPPNIEFEGVGIKAEALTSVTGYISSVDIALPGEGYQIPPLIKVIGDGFGAVLKSKISGYIYKTFITDFGLYRSDAVLSITPSSGNATFSGIMTTPDPDTGLIKLLEIAILNPGSGYDSIPQINIAAPPDRTARAATAYCSINAGISEIEIVSPGYGYTKSPKLSLIRVEPRADEIYNDRTIIKFTDITPTPTNTPSCTITPTSSYSPTITCTQTISPTKTYTPTFSPTLTKTVTPTPTVSVTTSDPTNLVISPSSIIAPTPTSSITVTPTNSITPSPTITKTKTPTPTLTPTKTITPTNTVTKTATPTITKTYSPTPSLSPTPSITPSPSTNFPDRVSYDAILIPRMSYGIDKINIIDPGRYRYNNIPTIQASPSYTAEYEAIIDNAGDNFEFTPDVKIIGSTISSAYRIKKDPECLPIINYRIGQVEIIDPGYDYTIPPKIILNGGYDPIKGQKAKLSANIGDSGRISSIDIISPGQYYRSYPDIKILSQDDRGHDLKIRLKLLGSLEKIYITEIGQNLTPNSPNNQIIFEGGGSGVTYPQAHIVLNNTAGSGFVGTAHINYHISYVKPESSNSHEFSPLVTLSNGNQRKFKNLSPRSGVIQSRIEGLAEKLIIEYSEPFSRCNNSFNNSSLDMVMIASKPLTHKPMNDRFGTDFNAAYYYYWDSNQTGHGVTYDDGISFWAKLLGGYTTYFTNGSTPYHEYTVPVSIVNQPGQSWFDWPSKSLNIGTYDIINKEHVVSSQMVRVTTSGSYVINYPSLPIGSGYIPNSVNILSSFKSFPPRPNEDQIPLRRGEDYDDSSGSSINLIKTLPTGTPLIIQALNTISGMEETIIPYNLFYEKPHILCSNSYNVSSKTYLTFAGYSASYTGAKVSPTSAYSGYLTTRKTGIWTYSDKAGFKSISHPDYTYGNVYYHHNNIGTNLSIEGTIKGLAYIPLTGILLDPTNNYAETLILPNFFNKLPKLAIEDEIGEGAEVTLTQNSENKLTRIAHMANYHYALIQSLNEENVVAAGNFIQYWLQNHSSGSYLSQSHDDWYKLDDNFTASGLFKSDITINADYGDLYTSRALLTCVGAGTPTSWETPPSLSVTVTNGSISNIIINNGGKGFGESLITNNKHLVYFSGGGGYGASGILLSTWPNPISNPYENQGSITGVLLLNSGVGYTSAPSAVIVDGSPTWNNIEYNNRVFNSTIGAFNNNIGIFPLVDFYFKDSYIAECTPLSSFPKYQISQGFIKCARDGAKDYQDNILNSYWSWIKPAQAFKDITNPSSQNFKWIQEDPYRIHSHFNNGVVDDILVNYIISGELTGYETTPEITISNSDNIEKHESILPELRAELPKWKTIFSDSALMRQDTIIE